MDDFAPTPSTAASFRNPGVIPNVPVEGGVGCVRNHGTKHAKGCDTSLNADGTSNEKPVAIATDFFIGAGAQYSCPKQYRLEECPVGPLGLPTTGE